MSAPCFRLVLGAVRIEWCDYCLLSHETATVYALDNADPITAQPIGIWAPDHAEETR